MKIWLDGDACPKAAKEILFKAAIRTQTELIIVANHMIKYPISRYISSVLVDYGFDEADKYIITHVSLGDLVITSDVLLADLIVKKDCIALNQRGVQYNETSIKQQLAVRNLMAELRDQNLVSGGPSSYNKFDAHTFAGQLDKLLTKLKSRI